MAPVTPDGTPAAEDRLAARPATTVAPRLVALMTCFNRRSMTLACLEALAAAAQRAGLAADAVLVDDASTDGTADAVRRLYPWVEVVAGSGNLFWNRGMHMAFGRAMQRNADYYLWINDDTHLVPDALERMLRQSAELAGREHRPVILVGATAHPGSTHVSYGGRVREGRWRPFRYRLVFDERQPTPCHAIEGNCVLIPREVALRVGNLDPLFEHAMGDTDYGLRAAALDVPSFVAAGIVGHCSPNSLGGTYFDTSLPLARRWKLIRSRKGLPVRSWLHFCRRHGGIAWPLHFAWPYAKVIATGLTAALTGRRAPAAASIGPR